jgi:hypothetical protein
VIQELTGSAGRLPRRIERLRHERPLLDEQQKTGLRIDCRAVRIQQLCRRSRIENGEAQGPDLSV